MPTYAQATTLSTSAAMIRYSLHYFILSHLAFFVCCCKHGLVEIKRCRWIFFAV